MSDALSEGREERDLLEPSLDSLMAEAAKALGQYLSASRRQGRDPLPEVLDFMRAMGWDPRPDWSRFGLVDAPTAMPLDEDPDPEHWDPGPLYIRCQDPGCPVLRWADPPRVHFHWQGP